MSETTKGHTALLSALRGIGEVTDARAAEIRALRKMPTDIIERLIDTGVFRTWVPTRYGGRGGSAMDLFEAIETLGYYHASAGWCVMVGGTTALFSGFLSPEWAREIFGNPRAVTGGFANPVGRGHAVDGGLKVTGRWGWDRAPTIAPGSPVACR